ncbi:MAG TPA: anthrone oxygenase family protein [Chloroflexia bacterium]|nr:anthrone oxygenase family protein [Chloroflexia bacterium]
MNAETIVGFVNLFCVGILAGEEFVIRYGVRAPVARLDARPQIELRQALIRSLRILVPAVFAATILSGAAVTIVAGVDHGFGFRCAGLLALLTFIGITLAGTVPINAAALDWEAAAPPPNWRALITRWERLDTARSWAAMMAFALFLTAMALQ